MGALPQLCQFFSVGIAEGTASQKTLAETRLAAN